MSDRARVGFYALLAFACGLLAALLIVGARIGDSPDPTIVYVDENPVTCRALGLPPGDPPIPICPGKP